MDEITLFENTCNDSLINNCYFSLDTKHGNSLIYSVFNTNDEFILKSNEFTSYLKKHYFDKNLNMYSYFLINENYFKSIKLQNNYSYIDYDVFSFITAFSCGTTHGFSAFFEILYEYSKLSNKKKIIVYNDTLPGILQLIEMFISDDYIIYLQEKSIYKFKSIQFVDITKHIFVLEDIPLLDKLISKYIKYDNVPDYKYSGLFKTNKTKNLTVDGTFDEEKCNSFCLLNKINRINPEIELTEIDIIKILKKTEHYITTFGTSFTKNIYYLSDICKKITVLVFGYEHLTQICERVILNDINSVPTKVRNSNVQYIFINEYSEFNLNELENNNNTFLELKKNKFQEYIIKQKGINLINLKKNYSDLKKLTDIELEKHYFEHGQKENRIHEFIIKNKYINTEIYRINYPDLFNLDDIELLYHYFEYGQKEGRVHQYILNSRKNYEHPILTKDTFNYSRYKNKYSDLNELSNKQLWEHWIKSGINEGRTLF